MDDNIYISHSKQTAPPAGQQGFSGFQASREAERATRVSEPMNDTEFKAAIERLSKNLSSGRPLRHDVPRGYYLNVQI